MSLKTLVNHKVEQKATDHLLVSTAAGFCAVLVRLALCFTLHALISRNLATARIEKKKKLKQTNRRRKYERMMGTPPLTNFTNMTSSTPTSLPYLGPLFMEYTRVVFYAIISIVGTIGNTLVILAYRNPRMRSVTNLFIANLAVADLTVCLINTPVAVIYSTLKRWPFGLFLCKLINYIQGITVFASVGTLMAIAADRYRAIVHPLLPRIRKRHAITIIVAIWIVASIFPFPLFFYQKLDDRSIFCSEEWPSVEAQKIYTVFVAVALYVIPLTVISLLYFLICHNLNSSQATTQEGKCRHRDTYFFLYLIFWGTIIITFKID